MIKSADFISGPYQTGTPGPQGLTRLPGPTIVGPLIGIARAILVHLPVHASWLNQVEVYFSLLQRKVLTPNDSTDLQELELRIKLYEELTNQQLKPFNWRFTKSDLFDLLQRLARREAAAKASAPGTLASRV
jgi:hypothetical protein